MFGGAGGSTGRVGTAPSRRGKPAFRFGTTTVKRKRDTESRPDLKLTQFFDTLDLTENERERFKRYLTHLDQGGDRPQLQGAAAQLLGDTFLRKVERKGTCGRGKRAKAGVDKTSERRTYPIRFLLDATEGARLKSSKDAIVVRVPQSKDRELVVRFLLYKIWLLVKYIYRKIAVDADLHQDIRPEERCWPYFVVKKMGYSPVFSAMRDTLATHVNQETHDLVAKFRCSFLL